jgi:hypothetical protein
MMDQATQAESVFYLLGVSVDDPTSNSGTYIAIHDHHLPLDIGTNVQSSSFSNGMILHRMIVDGELPASFFADYNRWVLGTFGV